MIGVTILGHGYQSLVFGGSGPGGGDALYRAWTMSDDMFVSNTVRAELTGYNDGTGNFTAKLYWSVDNQPLGYNPVSGDLAATFSNSGGGPGTFQLATTLAKPGGTKLLKLGITGSGTWALYNYNLVLR